MSDLVPKNFIIRCPSCRWAKSTSGTKDDLVGLYEVKRACATCHGNRKFRCPKCGSPATMQRVRGNAQKPPIKNGE